LKRDAPLEGTDKDRDLRNVASHVAQYLIKCLPDTPFMFSASGDDVILTTDPPPSQPEFNDLTIPEE